MKIFYLACNNHSFFIQKKKKEEQHQRKTVTLKPDVQKNQKIAINL